MRSIKRIQLAESGMGMSNTEKALQWAETLIQQTDEHLPCCSEALKVELIEQREFAVVAIKALQEKIKGEANKPLTIDQLRAMNGCPVYCVDAKNNGRWALVHTDAEICTDADFCDWEFYCYGWTDDGKLNENGWLAYR